MEALVMGKMVALYCKKNHHHACLCPDCQVLYEYALARMEKCPRKAEKTFCSSCPVHCYKPEMRHKIRQVMRYAGPRMLIYAPGLALSHVWDTIRHGRKKD